MKFLVVLAVVLGILWLMRGNRRSADTAAPRAGGPGTAQQQEMVQCPVCLVHLPRSDALPGPDGRLYCCPEHRARAEA
jgi:uncharacterized protein